MSREPDVQPTPAVASAPGAPGAATKAPAVSIVVPVYNEAGNVSILLDEIAAALAGRTWEVVAVDDGSTDGSFAELVALRARHASLRIVRFARNAGQSAAFAAGFRAARGAVFVTMDADLQNDPADVPALLDALDASGLEAAAGWRMDRQDSGWKLVQSRIANGVRNRLNHETIRDTGCSLKAFRREAVADIPWFTGMHRFLPTLVKMRGGRVVEVGVHHRPRRFGTTKYGMWNRVFRALADALAVRWMQRRVLHYEIRETVE
jgi:dolichol-phosphate mannosyltransferase